MAGKDKVKKILVVEDEEDLRKFVVWTLQAEGYRVVEATDGDEGLKLAQNNHFDLVIIDLRLPVRDGWSLLEELKSSPSTSAIPVIIFTASAEVIHRGKALKMGAAEYLLKPISAKDLLECCNRQGLKS